MTAARALTLKRDTRLSRWFSAGEVVDSATARMHRVNNVPPPAEAGVWSQARRLALETLDPVRDHLGRRMTVTSWYRSAEVNRLVGGSRTSDHRTGRAADVLVDGFTSLQLGAVFLSLGVPCDQLWLYEAKPHTHVSNRGPGANRGQVWWQPAKGPARRIPWPASPRRVR